MGAYVIAVCRHTVHLSYWPLSLWSVGICYPVTQNTCDVQFISLPFPLFPWHPLTLNSKGKTSSWVGTNGTGQVLNPST